MSNPARLESGVAHPPCGHWQRAVGWALLAIAIRLMVFAVGPAQDIQRAMQPDSPRYLNLAENLVMHGALGLAELEHGPTYGPIESRKATRLESQIKDEHGLYPEMVRTPGYPAWVAALGWLGRGPAAVLVFQSLLSGLAVMLAYRLAWHFSASCLVGDLAALLLAFHPADILACHQLLSDGLFAFLVFAAMVALMVWRPSWWVALGVGLLLGGASLVRPMGLLLGPVIAAVAVAFWPKTKRNLAVALTLAAVSLIPPGLWMARNHAISGRWTLSTIGPVVAYTKTVAFMRMQQQDRHVYPDDWLAQLPVLMQELDQQIRPDETVEQAMNRLAMQEIRRSPGLYLRLLGRSMLKTMTDHSMPAMAVLLGGDYRPTGLGDWLGGRGQTRRLWPILKEPTFWLAIGWALWNLMLVLGMPLGWWRFWKDGHRMAAGLMMAATLYFLLATQLVGLERMRLPWLGLQMVAAASAMGWIRQSFFPGQRARA